MKKQNQKRLCISACLLAAFVLWTVGVSYVDVRAIGPESSTVGFATINRAVHSLTGVSMPLYTVTDWLGLVPIGFATGFALFGLVQWIRRKSIRKVDHSILILGIFYIIVIAAYVFFETFAVNYRPVLINGFLETSYPSSTTLLVLCVMPTALMQFNDRIRNTTAKRCIRIAISAFIAFMVIGRLFSGVHWFSDIVGGILLSAGLVMLYYTANGFAKGYAREVGEL